MIILHANSAKINILSEVSTQPNHTYISVLIFLWLVKKSTYRVWNYEVAFMLESIREPGGKKSASRAGKNGIVIHKLLHILVDIPFEVQPLWDTLLNQCCSLYGFL